MTNKTTNLKKPVSTTLNDNHRILAQGRYINKTDTFSKVALF